MKPGTCVLASEPRICCCHVTELLLIAVPCPAVPFFLLSARFSSSELIYIAGAQHGRKFSGGNLVRGNDCFLALVPAVPVGWTSAKCCEIVPFTSVCLQWKTPSGCLLLSCYVSSDNWPVGFRPFCSCVCGLPRVPLFPFGEVGVGEEAGGDAEFCRAHCTLKQPSSWWLKTPRTYP